MNKTKHKISLKRFILLFVGYTFIFMTVFSVLDYYEYYIINPMLLVLFSIVLGLISAFVHSRGGDRSRIDDIVDKL